MWFYVKIDPMTLQLNQSLHSLNVLVFTSQSLFEHNLWGDIWAAGVTGSLPHLVRAGLCERGGKHALPEPI